MAETPAAGPGAPPAIPPPTWFPVLRTTTGLRTRVALTAAAAAGVATPLCPASRDAPTTEGERRIAEAHVGFVPAFIAPSVLLVAMFAVPMVLRAVVEIPQRVLTNLRSAEVVVPFVVLLVLWGILRTRCNRFLLTSERVVFRTGILFRQGHAVSLSEVVTVHVEQSMLGKLANYGTVHLWATGGVCIPMVGIANTHGFQRTIEEQVKAVSAQRWGIGLV